MSGHFHKYFTSNKLGILCLVPLSQQIYEQIKTWDVSRQALSTSSDKEITVVFYVTFAVFTAQMLMILVLLYATLTEGTGKETMERNNWASQNSQRVVELRKEEMPRWVAGNLTHSKVLSSILFDVQANNEFNNPIAHDWWGRESRPAECHSFLSLLQQ